MYIKCFVSFSFQCNSGVGRQNGKEISTYFISLVSQSTVGQHVETFTPVVNLD